MSTTTTISLSLEALLEEIYATSAMYRIVNAKRTTPPALHRDHRAMLEKAVRHGFAHVCMPLMPFLTNIDIEDDEMLTLDMAIPEGLHSARISALRLILTHAVTSQTLALVYGNYDSGLAESNESAANDAVAHIRRTLSSPLDPPQLVASWM